MPQPPKPSDRERSPRHRTERGSRTDFKRAMDAVRQLSNAGLEPSDLAQYELEAGAERGDRGAAILMATNLENALQFAIVRMLRIRPKRRSELFGFNAPVGTFSYKIVIGHAIGIFDDVTRTNLDIVRAVRNAFAHARRPIRFTDAAISALCGYLIVPRLIRREDLEFLSGVAEIPESPVRTKFRTVCTNLSFNFLAHNSRGPFRIAPAGVSLELPTGYEAWAIEKPLP